MQKKSITVKKNIAYLCLYMISVDVFFQNISRYLAIQFLIPNPPRYLKNCTPVLQGTLDTVAFVQRLFIKFWRGRLTTRKSKVMPGCGWFDK